jgi:acyl dehydratase
VHVFESREAVLATAPGTDLGAGEWLQVTQTMIDQFAEATHDHQWIHIDPEKAADGPFGTTIAHGYLTLSLVSKLVWSVYSAPYSGMTINVGTDRVRFVAVVPVGSRLRASCVLAEVDERPDGSIRLAFDTTVEMEGSDKPAAVVRHLAQLF